MVVCLFQSGGKPSAVTGVHPGRDFTHHGVLLLTAWPGLRLRVIHGRHFMADAEF